MQAQVEAGFEGIALAALTRYKQWTKGRSHASCRPGLRRRAKAQHSHDAQLVNIPVAFKQHYLLLLVPDLKLTTNDARSYGVYGQCPEN